MRKVGLTIRDTLLWTYGRGTWQYDLMCALILAFIFLSPTALFRENRSRHQLPPRVHESTVVPSSTEHPPSATTTPSTDRR